MPQFFIKDDDIVGKKTVIRGDDFHHLTNVRRIKTGSILRLRSESGKGYSASVREICGSEIGLDIVEEFGDAENALDITLYMALIKGGNFEFVLQKAVEVGVNRIIPVITSRTVPDPEKKINAKHERWNRITENAAKQCLRASIPEVGYPVAFQDIQNVNSAGLKLLAHPGAITELRDYLSMIDRPESIDLLVGPEGGFSDNEIRSASENGWVPVNFGNNHLRAETAAVVLPSVIIYQWS